MEINVQLVNQFFVVMNGFSVKFIERKTFKFVVCSGSTDSEASDCSTRLRTF